MSCSLANIIFARKVAFMQLMRSLLKKSENGGKIRISKQWDIIYMIKTEITLPLKYNSEDVRLAVLGALPVNDGELGDVRLIKRTLCFDDSTAPHYKATVAFSVSEEREMGLLRLKRRVSSCPDFDYKASAFRGNFRPVVVGFGPAGLFAALVLAESGARPIILERGLPVNERKARVDAFSLLGILDTECNVQFGEGGAGTYSDGKLKVGSHDKYKRKVIDELIQAGAPEDIAYSTTAHLGTDKLGDIVTAIRKKIERLGGDVIFSARFTELIHTGGELRAIRYEKDGRAFELPTRAVVLAIGHSARDTITSLYGQGMQAVAKGFGVGVRIEHPREYINKVVYGKYVDDIEETASYHLVTHLPNGRSVYSFCMCPGGSVVAASSEANGIVTNGMSEYGRMADNSNAALLVSVTPEDFGVDHPLGGIAFQRSIERCAFSLTKDYRAPSQILGDFVGQGRKISPYGSVKPSYPRGVESISTEAYLPDFICDSLRMSLPDFDEWLPGYYLPDSVLTGPETRTTSPVRFLRDERYQALNFVGVFPCGEGAGYAGGIVSSATDGVRIAEALILGFGT